MSPAANDGGDTLDELALDFGIRRDQPVDTVAKRLHSWALLAEGGSINCLRAGGVSYSWDARPRLQKNGAAIGRVYAQARGQLTHDIGAYKIGADGRVLILPAELRGVLPGGEAAAAAAQDELEASP